MDFKRKLPQTRFTLIFPLHLRCCDPFSGKLMCARVFSGCWRREVHWLASMANNIEIENDSQDRRRGRILSSAVGQTTNSSHEYFYFGRHKASSSWLSRYIKIFKISFHLKHDHCVFFSKTQQAVLRETIDERKKAPKHANRFPLSPKRKKIDNDDKRIKYCKLAM